MIWEAPDLIITSKSHGFHNFLSANSIFQKEDKESNITYSDLILTNTEERVRVAE